MDHSNEICGDLPFLLGTTKLLYQNDQFRSGVIMSQMQSLKKGVDYTGITVVFFCHDGNGNVLFAKRSVNCRDEQGRWDVGGGGVEFGDTFEKTLRDEIFQEYCADVLDFQMLGHREVFREQNGCPTHWIAFDFVVHVDRKKVAIGEPHKFDALDWFTLETLPEPLHSQFPNFLERYRDTLVRHLSPA